MFSPRLRGCLHISWMHRHWRSLGASSPCRSVPCPQSSGDATNQLASRWLQHREWYWWFFSHGFYPVITPMLSLFHYVPPFSTVFHHSSCQHIVAKILAQTSDFLWPSSPEISEISWHQVSTWLSWWVSVQRNCPPCVCRPPPSSSSCLT